MNHLSRKFMMTTMIALGSLSTSFGQTQNEPKPNTKKSSFVYKGMVWGLIDTKLNQPSVNLISANVLKHKKLNGFGVMGLVVTKPLDIGKGEKPTIPLGSLLIHWGNPNMNFNFGPTTKFNGGPIIDGFKGIANLNGQNGGKVGGRIIWDTDKNPKHTMNLAAHIRYQVTKKMEATLGSNTNGNIQVGMSINIK